MNRPDASRFSFGPFTAILAILVVGSLVPLKAQTFEGVVQFNLTSAQGEIPMTYMMKGENVRMEFEGRPGMKGVMLLDGKENKAYMLISQMNAYMELPTGQTQEGIKTKPEITKTGKTQKILGFDCEQLIIKDGARVTEAWVTKAIGKFQKFGMGGRAQQGNPESWQDNLAGSGMFPVRVVTKEGDTETSKMEVTKVEKKSLEASLFKIPEGYQKMSMPMGKPR
jgi:hypothetical protein